MNNTRILVVDDEPDLESLLTQKFRRQIKEGDCHLPVCARWRRCLIDACRPILIVDMVISDINMPRMDGLSLLEKLQEDERKTVDYHRVGLWRYGQYPGCNESRRFRFSD